MKDKIRLLAVVIPLIIGILTFPPNSTLTYDGALYINIARSIARGEGFTYQGVYMMYRPPLYPYTLSLFFKFLPYDFHLPASRIISLLFYTLTALLTYEIGKMLLGSRKFGIIASLLYVFNPLAFTMAKRTLVHSEFTFFFTLSMYLFYLGERENRELYTVLSFFFAGLTILARYTGLVILGVFVVYLYLTREWNWIKERRYIIGLLILLLTLSPWLYLGHLHYGGAFRPFKIASRVVTLDKPVSTFEFFELLVKDIGYIPLFLLALGIFFTKRNEKGLLVLSWFFVGLMGILTVTHKETRFITFTTPAMALIMAKGIQGVVEKTKNIPHKAIFEGIGVGVILILLFNASYNLQEFWNKTGRGETEVLSWASKNYNARTVLVTPYLYTYAGYFFPESKVEMITERNYNEVVEKIKQGYYDLVIIKGGTIILNRYTLVKTFYDGLYKIFERNR